MSGKPGSERGRLLLALVLGFLAVVQVFGLVAELGRWPQVNWVRGVVGPVLLLLGLHSVWQGERWLRWLLGGVLLVRGGCILYVVGRILWVVRDAAAPTPEVTGLFLRVLGLPLGLLGGYGLLEVACGLVLLLAPAVRAFERYQQARASGGA